MGLFDSLVMAFNDAVNTVACEFAASNVDTTVRIVPRSSDSVRATGTEKNNSSKSSDKYNPFPPRTNNSSFDKSEAKAEPKPEPEPQPMKYNGDDVIETTAVDRTNEPPAPVPMLMEKNPEPEQPVAADTSDAYPYTDTQPMGVVDFCKKINKEFEMAIESAIRTVSEDPSIKPSLDRLNAVSTSMNGIENKTIEEINRIDAVIADLQNNLQNISNAISYVYTRERGVLQQKLISMASAYSTFGDAVKTFADQSIPLAIARYDKAANKDIYNISLYHASLYEAKLLCDMAKRKYPGFGNHNVDIPKPKKQKIMLEGIIPIEDPNSADPDYSMLTVNTGKPTLPDYSNIVDAAPITEGGKLKNNNEHVMNDQNREYIKLIDSIADECSVIVTMRAHKKTDGTDSGLISCYTYEYTENGPVLNVNKSFTIDHGNMIDRRAKVFPCVDPSPEYGGFEAFNAYGIKIPNGKEGMVWNEKLFRDIFNMGCPVIDQRNF